jgi:hypothetical protein
MQPISSFSTEDIQALVEAAGRPALENKNYGTLFFAVWRYLGFNEHVGIQVQVSFHIKDCGSATKTPRRHTVTTLPSGLLIRISNRIRGSYISVHTPQT